MNFKKFGGNIFGVELTPKEEKAMNKEINRQIVEKDKEYQADLDAMVLYVLMVKYDWGEKRLRAFWEAFDEAHKELREHYMMDDEGDNEWLAHEKLKSIGVDVRQWVKERNE